MRDDRRTNSPGIRAGKDPRRVVAEALLQVGRDGAYSNLVAERRFDALPAGRERAFASALFYGVLERELTLRHILRRCSKKPPEKLDPEVLTALEMGLYQLLYLGSVPERAAVNESVALVKKLGKGSAAGFVNGVLRSFRRDGKALPLEELEGVERSSPLGMADDVLVSVRGRGVELTVKKTFDAPAQAALPRFTGLSHVCIFVDDMMAAVSYYRRLLGAVPDHYLSHWRNRGFFQAAGFLDEAGKGDVSIAFVNVPGARLTLELMQYHYPEGRKEPVFFAANDVSGVRHVALKVTNIDEAFLHVKAMPDTRLISESPAYRPFRISETTPDQVRFFDQDLRESDERNEQTAKILSQVRYFYFIDRYGLQWEFEQGHSDIGD